MNGILVVVMVFLLLAASLGVVAYLVYQRKLRRAKAIERGLKMVPIQIHLPPPSADTVVGSRDVRDVMREKTAQAEVLYNLLAGTASEGFKSKFYGQRHIALEIIASHGLVHFYAAVPVAMVSVVKKSIQTAYPGALLEEVEDHNIFNQEGRLAATMGGEIILKADSAYPISTYEELDRDPLEAIITTLSGIGKDDGAAIQVMVRPATSGWVKHSTKLVERLHKGESKGLGFNAMDLARAVASPPTTAAADAAKQAPSKALSNLQLGTIERIENKTKQPGFEVLVRLVVSTQTVATSQQLLRDLATAFALFEAPGLNGFKFLPAIDVQGLVTAFIMRFFPPEMHSSILNSTELATLFHLPDSQFVPTANVERQASKEVDGPVSLPSSGLLFGFNEFRGVKKEIRLSTEDRRRHTYVLGQTGTGKSTLLENLAVQDMLAGNGFAFIDPHGDTAEKLLSMVPKSRAEDVIYFNPSDTEYPLGLNLFEFSDPAQKDFLIQETISMLYKLYDPNGTGVIGPRFEQWYRNAALTLMSDPAGATFLEIPKVFTDTEYLKQKFRYLKDPTVIDFWTKEMGQTSDYHKSEMLGYFVSKFGAFQQNEIMRNIIGQTKSAFDLRDIMDHKKILIVNLSKGQIGELNSKLLGMMFVIKFQAAAMSRADMPEAERTDFSLYVDEFQNFSTDSFASILSEARKYRLNLIVANQFIGQLTNEIRDAVFGNIGTILGMRMGPEDAEFMVKQFTPIFDARDLVNLPNGHAAIRMMLGGVPSQPFTIRGLPPLGTANPELGLAIKQLSAAKFGATKAMVEADITARLSGRTAPVAPPAPAAEALEQVAIPATPAEVPDATPVAAAPTVFTPQLQAPVTAEPVPAAPEAPEPQAAAPTAPVLALTPPPIGAPPVDSISAAAPVFVPVPPIIPEPEPVQAIVSPSVVQPLAASHPGGLSISDITGGRMPGASVATPGTAYIPPIGAPPMDLPFTASPVLSEAQASGGMPLPMTPGQGVETGSSEAAEALSAIPLIPAGAEPKQPALTPSKTSDESPQMVSRTRVIELADTPLADDPMATIPLIEDLRPISIVETSAATPPPAPETSPVEAPAPVPAFDPTSMVALTPNESQQQPEPSSETIAAPQTAPSSEPARTEAQTWSETAEPEPRSVPQPEAEEDLDFSGSLVHFTEPKFGSGSEQPLDSAAPVAPASSPVTEVPTATEDQIMPEIPAVPDVGQVPAQLAFTPPPIGAPPLGTAEPVTLAAPAPAPAAVAPSPPASEPVPTVPPAIGAPPVDIALPAVESANVEAVPDTVALPEITSEPFAVRQPEVETPLPDIEKSGDVTPVLLDEVDETPRIESVSSVPAVEEPPAIKIEEEKPANVEAAVPENTEPVTAAPLASTSEGTAKPEAELNAEPERSSDDVMAAVMEAARLRQAEREAAPAEASAPVPDAAEPSPEPASETSSPAAFTPEILDNLPVIDPVLATEDQIDDLLNTSIIHDSHPSSSRLPEPDENSASQNDATKTNDEVVTSQASSHHRLPDVVTALNADEQPTPEEDGRDHALTGGHKVIQPLEPIVSHQEEFSQELKRLEAEEKLDVSETPQVEPQAKLSVSDQAVEDEPAIKDTAVLLPPPALVPFEAPEPAVPAVISPEPIVMPEDDFGLPEAESLEAGDVAALRAKREADERAAQAEAEARAQNSPTASQEAPIESGADAAASNDQPPEEVNEKPLQPKRKRLRHRSKPQSAATGNESAQPQEETDVKDTVAETVVKDVPADADKTENSNTGNLIMPSAASPLTHTDPAPAAAVARPEKLAKGEVFVDDKGNVIVGE